MKTLVDGTEVSARSYYFLLDFNDADSWKTLIEFTKKNRLCDLNITEYTLLFKEATRREITNLQNKTK